MTLQELDDALAVWKSRLAAVAQNLLELQAEPTYKLMTGSGLSRVALGGESATQAEPALRAIRRRSGASRTAIRWLRCGR
jgi:hypothetical protein